MTRGSVREYAAAVRRRYLAAGKSEKGLILGEFCRTTGYHRKAAVRLLRRSPPDGSAARCISSGGGCRWRCASCTRTPAGRYLAIVYQEKARGLIRPFTGWDMRPYERELYGRQVKD